jgi:hypothetical protein
MFSELGGYNNTKRRGTRGAEISTAAYPIRYLFFFDQTGSQPEISIPIYLQQCCS